MVVSAKYMPPSRAEGLFCFGPQREPPTWRYDRQVRERLEEVAAEMKQLGYKPLLGVELEYRLKPVQGRHAKHEQAVEKCRQEYLARFPGERGALMHMDAGELLYFDVLQHSPGTLNSSYVDPFMPLTYYDASNVFELRFNKDLPGKELAQFERAVRHLERRAAEFGLEPRYNSRHVHFSLNRHEKTGYVNIIKNAGSSTKDSDTLCHMVDALVDVTARAAPLLVNANVLESEPKVTINAGRGRGNALRITPETVELRESVAPAREHLGLTFLLMLGATLDKLKSPPQKPHTQMMRHLTSGVMGEPAYMQRAQALVSCLLNGVVDNDGRFVPDARYTLLATDRLEDEIGLRALPGQHAHDKYMDFLSGIRLKGDNRLDIGLGALQERLDKKSQDILRGAERYTFSTVKCPYNEGMTLDLEKTGRDKRVLAMHDDPLLASAMGDKLQRRLSGLWIGQATGRA